MSSCRCNGCDSQFGAQHAAKDIKRYRESGPDRTTRLLLDALKAKGVQGSTLLDIGAGIGVIHHELLSVGLQAATHVDATDANIEIAEQEATRRGHADRVDFVQGDFVELASEIPAADIVTLDRVICCYPNMEQLVSASAAKSRRLYGAVYPRERWPTKVWVALENFVRRVLGNPFRTFVHPVGAIDDLLERNGLKRQSVHDTFVWRVAVYARQ
ncbi:MAG TPA: methyltransferase domain-containing protein [Gemmatimonadaceae bacterium]|nr:methyltransferase domain-containing protein [Gemmatimonadaceae bacterium]